MDEIMIPLELILPILETLTKNSVDIESSFELIPRSKLNKIQMKPLRRLKPSPKPVPLPYKNPYQFFNRNSEPIFELLTNAFHISLKSMEEDALIFPSDIVVEADALKARVCD
jgi:hypothetical protein